MRHVAEKREGFTEVLTAWSWWDLPRRGAIRINDVAYRFRCDFDEALDDYPAEYEVWTIGEDELQNELATWERWATWRRSFDRGEHPAPLDDDPAWKVLSAQIAGDPPPGTAIEIAKAEWRLDPDRSFAIRNPCHLVRFVAIGDAGAATT